ncbi:MAG: phosphoenolpyruvate--protein phosphotransferase [Desulfovibrionales bacterium]|nr:MAG: phosphoenolpyruvate--protein phosphotransferase [Desulfovibrionales bacterium]
MDRHVLQGIPVSTGVALGRAYFLNRGRGRNIPRQNIPDNDVQSELVRVEQAFSQALAELETIQSRVPAELLEHARIIESHIMMLQDPKLLESAKAYIRDMQLNAEWALEKAVADIEAVFRSIEDVYIRERIQDVRLVAGRVQQYLLGESGNSLRSINTRIILLAHDLSPADTIELEVGKIMAFATVTGGKTSHTGILARAMQIPAIVGVADLEETIQDGQLIIIDGLQGRIIIEPDEDELASFTDLKYQFEEYQAGIIRSSHLPAETIDGYRVKVFANIELLEEVSSVLGNGGEGVGLYRTEYSYLNRVKLPEEEQLLEEYQDLASIMYPSKVVLRTLDVGSDKFMNHFGGLDEANPALGMRAVRFCLHHLDLFRIQLRAILRASVHENISLMFPMVSGLGELRQVKSVLHSVQMELKQQGLPYNPEMPVGIMIELPSAMITADILATEVDFFSIGTNDLIQYSLGIDRTNSFVSYLYQPLHPALVRMIKYVVDAGHRAGIEVSICGEMAADPYCIPVLMGMHVDCLSMNPQAVPVIKHIIRQATMEECKSLLRDVLASKTVGRNNKLVKDSIFRRHPKELMFYSSMLDEGY